ncbi:MAG: helix-turn-helix transcriptional regulator [Ruminococcaceae bacterium]|nr:helix-turn-helix transcriptional regulator [Oscillospiraceae bacterium]
MRHFTHQLKEIRLQKTKSQEEIGNVLGITKQQYQLYESGKREIKVNQIITLCEYYNISPEYILGFTDEQKPLR